MPVQESHLKVSLSAAADRRVASLAMLQAAHVRALDRLRWAFAARARSLQRVIDRKIASRLPHDREDAALLDARAEFEAMNLAYVRNVQQIPEVDEQHAVVFGFALDERGAVAAGVQVTAHDRNGRRLAGVEPVTTDASGAYALVLPVPERGERKHVGKIRIGVRKGSSGAITVSPEPVTVVAGSRRGFDVGAGG